MKLIDKSKKSNKKCEHCKNWSGWTSSKCSLSGEDKKYYQRCKSFEWNPSMKYKGVGE